MDAIEFRGVALALGSRLVLADISLRIADGEFVGVLGPNGAGKTTMLRAVLGLVRPAAGTIRVLGRPVRRGNPEIGYMPQTRASPGTPTISGRDFVASVVRGHRLGLPVLLRRDRVEIDRALDLVGAAGLACRPLADLSGGERQRLLLAQALIGRPRLLLLDEPLTSLDPHREREVVGLVRRVQRELGIAVLFCAHELNPLVGAMDRVLYLGSGQAALGTIEEVFTGPVLSRLYGTEIEVVRAGGHLLVMAGGRPVERDPHRHAEREMAPGHV